MFNGMAIVTVTPFSSNNPDVKKVDKNGNGNVILSPVLGVIPSKRVISGSVAMSSGLLPGKTYLVSISETAEDEEYGRQFAFTNAGAVTPVEIMQFKSTFEAPSVLEIDPVVKSQGAPKANENVSADATDNA